MISCLVCGASLRDGARFCGKCGSRQDPAAAQPAAPSSPDAQPERLSFAPHQSGDTLPADDSSPKAAILAGDQRPSNAPQRVVGSDVGTVQPDTTIAFESVSEVHPSQSRLSIEQGSVPEQPVTRPPDLSSDVFPREEDALSISSPISAAVTGQESVPFREEVVPTQGSTPAPPLLSSAYPTRLPFNETQGVSGQPASRNRQMPLAMGAIALLALVGSLAFWFSRQSKNPTVAEVHPGVVAQAPVASPPQSLAPQPDAPSPVPALQSNQDSRAAADLRRAQERLDAERVRLDESQRQAREQEARRQQEQDAQRQADADAQRRAMEELRAKQEEQQRQLEEANRKLAEEKARRDQDDQVRQSLSPKSAPTVATVPAPPVAAKYSGPSSGEIVWEGTLRGTELITIDNGQASSGTVTGSFPGVPILIQPTDPKKVSIASAPGPRNQYGRLVIRVSGNGPTRVTLKWSLP